MHVISHDKCISGDVDHVHCSLDSRNACAIIDIEVFVLTKLWLTKLPVSGNNDCLALCLCCCSKFLLDCHRMQTFTGCLVTQLADFSLLEMDAGV